MRAQSPSEYIDRFFDDYYFKFYPSIATQTGVHKYDNLLEDYSRAGVEARVKSLRLFERQFGALPAAPDREIMLSFIRAQLLELERVRSWEEIRTSIRAVSATASSRSSPAISRLMQTGSKPSSPASG